MHLDLPLVLLLLQDLLDQVVCGSVALEVVGAPCSLKSIIENSFLEEPLGVIEVSGVIVGLLLQQEVDGLLCEFRQISHVPGLLDFEIAANVVESSVDVHALQLSSVFCCVGVIPGEVFRDMDDEFVDLASLIVFAFLEQLLPLLSVLLIDLALDFNLIRVFELNPLQEDLVVEPRAGFLVGLLLFFHFNLVSILSNSPILNIFYPRVWTMHQLVADVEPSLLLDLHAEDFFSQCFGFITGNFGTGNLFNGLSVVVVFDIGNECFERVFFECVDRFVETLFEDVLGSLSRDEDGLDVDKEAKIFVHLEFLDLSPLVFDSFLRFLLFH